MKQLCLIAVFAALIVTGTPSFGTTTSNRAASSLNEPPFTNGHYVLTRMMKMNGYHTGAPTVVIVDKGSHSTYVLQLQGKNIERVLTVSNAIGSSDKPTPPGRFIVINKKLYPEWIPPVTIDKTQKKVPPYNETHRNPLGTAAIYLDKYELVLHGTNEPKLIRKSASHGCIRHSNADIMRVYSVVNKGNVVYIVRQFKGTVLNRSDFIKESKNNKRANKEEAEALPKQDTGRKSKSKKDEKQITYVSMEC